MRTHRHLTIQARIALLVIACVLPGWLLFAFDTYRTYERERSYVKQRTLQTARGLLRTVERDLGANIAALQTLAISNQIDRGDFAAFYREAKEALAYTSGYAIVLVDASGQQVVNLLRPYGAPLPRTGNPALLQRVLETRKPSVSDLYIGGVSKVPNVAIVVPVIRDEKVRYGLFLGFETEHLAEVLRQQGLPREWVVSIFDSDGTIVARDRAGEQFVGRKGSPALVKRMQEVHEDVIEVPTLEGILVMAAFSRSTAYGWSVGIGVPEEILTADLRRSLVLYAVGASLLLLVGLGLAAMIGRGIARPIQKLIAPALAIGKGKSESIPPLGLREADEVRQALLQAQQLLHEHVQERNAAEQAERKMLLAKQVAEQANVAKATFLANVSHELRTPLNAILGFSRLVRNAPGIPAEQIKNLDIVNRSGEHLLNLINNVLDISRIESGHTALKETDIDLGQLLQEVQSLLQGRAAEKGLVLIKTQHARNLPQQVNVDADKLRQVLINLVGNAIKFTARGTVMLRAKLSRHESQQAWVRFEVEDTGPGISKDDRARVFLPFAQLRQHSQAEAGTGLGLSISKQFVELMGGHIGVASELGKGSVFHFEIPVGLRRQSAGISANSQHRRVTGLAPGQPSYRLLIAEDHLESRLLLRLLLEPLGFELREAADGHEAMALYELWRPHLILMDIGMPKADGLQVIRQIRASAAGANTKIVAITAHVFKDERNKTLAAGCDGFIRKPYRETEIFEALENNLGVRFVYAEEQSPAGAAGEVSLTQLERLPPDLLRELRDAAELLDGSRCLEIAAGIGADERELRGPLQRMVDDLQYTELLHALENAIAVRSA